jgi:hypothetical protein
MRHSASRLPSTISQGRRHLHFWELIGKTRENLSSVPTRIRGYPIVEMVANQRAALGSGQAQIQPCGKVRAFLHATLEWQSINSRRTPVRD